MIDQRVHAVSQYDTSVSLYDTHLSHHIGSLEPVLAQNGVQDGLADHDQMVINDDGLR